ncbi:uncharacterized protein [Nerophis lumbriciformis]|uniref:uncharacterized protein n=1 Tax=Nerophis lumbriciformis TaxID=546530 RepID=UPI002ADFDB1D|nr:uncharacterized protein LOC133620698 [Nerophis lumbriciformis]
MTPHEPITTSERLLDPGMQKTACKEKAYLMAVLIGHQEQVCLECQSETGGGGSDRMQIALVSGFMGDTVQLPSYPRSNRTPERAARKTLKGSQMKEAGVKKKDGAVQRGGGDVSLQARGRWSLKRRMDDERREGEEDIMEDKGERCWKGKGHVEQEEEKEEDQCQDGMEGDGNNISLLGGQEDKNVTKEGSREAADMRSDGGGGQLEEPSHSGPQDAETAGEVQFIPCSTLPPLCGRYPHNTPRGMRGNPVHLPPSCGH